MFVSEIFATNSRAKSIKEKKRGKLDFIKMKSFHSDQHIILKVVLGYISVDKPLPNIPKTRALTPAWERVEKESQEMIDGKHLQNTHGQNLP